MVVRLFRVKSIFSGDFVGGSQTSISIDDKNEGGIVTGDHNKVDRNLVVGDGNQITSERHSAGDHRNDDATVGADNEEINNAMAHLRVDLIEKVSADKKQQVGVRLSELEDELQKGSQAEDSNIAAMVKDLGEWVPTGKDAIKAAFAEPALKTIAEGMFTQFMLSQL